MNILKPIAIASLPNETLCSILLEVVQSDNFPLEVRKRHTALVQLGRVCHRWQDAIYSEHRLWAESSVEFLQELIGASENEALMDALEAFYHRSGSSVGLAIRCLCDGKPTQQVPSRLNEFLISMAHRWTKMELDSGGPGLGKTTRWIYPFLGLAKREKDRLGYSPFSNLKYFKLAMHARQSFSPIEGEVEMRVNLASFPLRDLFPNLTNFHLNLLGGAAKIVQSLYPKIAFKQLITLQLLSYDAVILQDLLAQLPLLRHLHASGFIPPNPPGKPFTHGALEHLRTADGRLYDVCSPLSLPTLQTLSLRHSEITAPPSASVLLALTTMLNNGPSNLRALNLSIAVLNEIDLYRLLVRLPTLETLVLDVPFGNRWDEAEGGTFKSLLEHSMTAGEMPLPLLREIVLEMVPMPVDTGGWFNPENAHKGFCAVRDAFISFVEDPRRSCGLTDKERDDMLEIESVSATTEEEQVAWGLAAHRLELAHFQCEVDSDSGMGIDKVVYHRGKEHVPLLFPGDRVFVW
jgi:F-box-like